MRNPSCLSESTLPAGELYHRPVRSIAPVGAAYNASQAPKGSVGPAAPPAASGVGAGPGPRLPAEARGVTLPVTLRAERSSAASPFPSKYLILLVAGARYIRQKPPIDAVFVFAA
jgi:hypothetical protein